MRESQTIDVDGVSYLINPMSPLKANRVMIDIFKMLGSPIATFLMQLVKGEKKVQSFVDVDITSSDNVQGIVDAIINLTSHLDADVVEAMIKTLLAPNFVIPDGKKYMNLETHFGNFGLVHMYKVMFEVLKVNFRDFLDVLSGDGL